MSYDHFIKQLNGQIQKAFNYGWYCGAAFGVVAGFGTAIILFTYMGFLK